MSGNPLVAQGTLNRGLVSLSAVNNPQLNVTTGFFGTKMARLTFEGETSDYIPTATGGVPSGKVNNMRAPPSGACIARISPPCAVTMA